MRIGSERVFVDGSLLKFAICFFSFHFTHHEILEQPVKEMKMETGEAQKNSARRFFLELIASCPD